MPWGDTIFSDDRRGGGLAIYFSASPATKKRNEAPRKMSSTKSLLQGLSDKVKCAREYALLGNYGTSLKYFEVAIDNVDS
ncbi:hypothetical protein D3C80_2086330 [compost metagenome]